MLVGLEFHADAATALEALGDVVRRHAFARAAMTFIAHGGNEQMRLIADLAAGRRNRIGARSQRTGQRAKFVGIKRDRKRRDEIDELASGDPFARLTVVEQRLDVLMAG